MFTITEPYFYIQDKETAGVTPSVTCPNFCMTSWLSDQQRPSILRSPDSGHFWHQDSSSHLHLQILSHLSINEFFFLHSEREFIPFPAQRQYNWERKVTIASKKFKSKSVNFGHGSTNERNSLTTWVQTPEPMWKRKAQWHKPVIPRTRTIGWEAGTELEIPGSASSRAANTRKILPYPKLED